VDASLVLKERIEQKHAKVAKNRTAVLRNLLIGKEWKGIPPV
jgi:hypothetical protein